MCRDLKKTSMKDFFLPKNFTAICALLLCAMAASFTQSAAAVTAGEMEDLKAAINTDSRLNEESKAHLVEQLNTARSQLEVAAEFTNRSSRLKTDIVKILKISTIVLMWSKAQQSDYG